MIYKIREQWYKTRLLAIKDLVLFKNKIIANVGEYYKLFCDIYRHTVSSK